MEALKADLPKLSDGEVTLRLMRLIASGNVDHNVVEVPLSMGFFDRLPLAFYWFSEGLAVTAASPEYSAALGARVLASGKMTPQQLLDAVAPYIAHENDSYLRVRSREFIRPRAVLEHLGLIGPDGRVAFSLEKAGQAPFTIGWRPPIRECPAPPGAFRHLSRGRPGQLSTPAATIPSCRSTNSRAAPWPKPTPIPSSAS